MSAPERADGIIPGPQGVRILALGAVPGAVPGAVYEPPDFSKIDG